MRDRAPQYWSMTEGMFNCLIDRRRTTAFASAIRATVRPGDVVVDLGSGTGVLALMAAKAGAGYVYAVESDASAVRQLRATIEANRLSRQVEVIHADATKVKLPKKADVIISEMVATGLVGELQIQATANALRQSSSEVRVLLKTLENEVALVRCRARYYGFEMPVVQYQYPDAKEVTAREMSDRLCYAVVDLTKPIDRSVRFVGTARARRAGLANALRVTTKTTFWDGATLGHSFAYCYPILLPVAPMRVRSGDLVRIKLSYTMCDDMTDLDWSVSRHA